MIERLIEEPENKPHGKTPSWQTMLENQDGKSSRRALIASNDDIKSYQVVSTILGFDAVLGKELFFNLPRWWVFGQVERGSLLVNSMERLKQTGFVTYFSQL